MPSKGKKIPSDVIVDRATRNAFDRVEQRLKTIEQRDSDFCIYREEALASYTAVSSGALVQMEIQSFGKTVEFWLRDDSPNTQGAGGILISTSTLEGGSTYQAELQLRLYRVLDSGVLQHIGVGEYGLYHSTGTAGGAKARFPFSSFRGIDVNPPIGSNRYVLLLVRSSTNGTMTIGVAPKLCALALK